MKKELCTTTFVSGWKYQFYIPFYLYFMKYSYPEYFSLIAYKEVLSNQVKESIKYLQGGNFRIAENVFRDFPEEKGMRSTLRWLMYFEEFKDFEYVYIGDIDLLYVRENPTLLERHKKVCDDNGTFYSNTVWLDDHNTRGIRFTGLHFVKSKPYYEKMLPIIKKYQELFKYSADIPEFFNDTLGLYDNQHAIYVMMKEAGIEVMDKEKPKNVFFEYNGLHLGDSRVPGRWEQRFMEDDLQKDYFKKFTMFLRDPLFWKLYFSTLPEIQNEFNILIKAGEHL